jgi:hypothetical protein
MRFKDFLIRMSRRDVSNSFDRRAFVRSPLPGSLAGLERIGKGAGSQCHRKGHGALCGGVPRGLSSRGRAVSPRAELRNQMYPGRGGAASVGSGGLAAHAKRDRALSVRGSNRAASAAARGAAAAAVASAALPSSGELGEGVVWESDGGFLSVFERTMELPDPDEPPGEGDESAGGTGGGDELGGASPGIGSLGRVRRQTVRWHVTGSPRCNFTSVVVFAYDTRSKVPPPPWLPMLHCCAAFARSARSMRWPDRCCAHPNGRRARLSASMRRAPTRG